MLYIKNESTEFSTIYELVCIFHANQSSLSVVQTLSVARLHVWKRVGTQSKGDFAHLDRIFFLKLLKI